MITVLRSTVAAALVLAWATVMQAQSAKGLFVGIQYSGASVNVKEAAQDLEFGNGFGVHAGIGLTDRFSLLANFDRSVLTGANDNDVELTQYDALLRMNLLGAGLPVKVFLTGGATARTANSGRDFEGIAPTGGAGAQLFITPRLAVHGTALWTFGNLTRASQLNGNDLDQKFTSTGTRIQAGASLYLFGK